MSDSIVSRSKHGLEIHGIRNVNEQYWNLTSGALYDEAIRRREGTIVHHGPLVVRTGHHTGRSPNDKYIVKEPSSEKNIWWGKVNRPIEPERFDSLHHRMLSYMQNREIFIQDLYAGTDPRYRLPIRVITESAWHNLFARNLFVRPKLHELETHEPQFTVINMPRFHAIPDIDGTNSEVFIIVNFGKRLVLIGGTSYAGEIKKSIFTVLNYTLPLQEVLSMHCSANVGKNEDVAVFFGLSGTGKTTLSADPHRRLIGDDEHGWSDAGVFNFEGGCYAKAIRLSKEAEPEIYATTRRFGTILENVTYDSYTRRLDLNDASLTENTRAAYPIDFIPNHEPSGMGGHPVNIIMLTADAFGVMPPISKLTPAQAMYHFLSGYTAKVAGTEKGLGKDPQATFSTCFGAPFMALHPSVYARMLGEKIAKHKVTCWLVNTGWTGGPFGEGQRMKIAYTRAMVNAALDGRLAQVATEEDSIFGLHIPQTCPDVPNEVLKPRNTWKNVAAYDEKAKHLAGLFHNNFAQFAKDVSEDIRAAGPKAQ